MSRYRVPVEFEAEDHEAARLFLARLRPAAGTFTVAGDELQIEETRWAAVNDVAAAVAHREYRPALDDGAGT